MRIQTAPPSTLTQLSTAIFTVRDQDAALAFYTGALGFEVRADVRFGAQGEHRWLEVAPPGSTARISLVTPVDGEPGCGAVGVDSTDVLAEHARLAAAGLDVGPPPVRAAGAPLLLPVRDPDGNTVWVVGRD